MKKAFFLDRNIVDLMSKYNRKCVFDDVKTKEKLDFLLKNDVDGNIFSPFFSLIEGKAIKCKDESGRVYLAKNTNKKIRELIKYEAAIVNDFIKNARTDYDFLVKNEKFLAKNIYEYETDYLINEKINFLNEIKDAISIIKPVSERESEYFKFKEISMRYNQFKQQPFTLMSIMYIFGSPRSSKLLKYPTQKFVAYNVISDFNHMKLFNKVKYTTQVTERFQISFESLDSDIGFINEIFNFNNVTVGRLTNFSHFLNLEWQPNFERIDNEIPDINKGGDNKDIFYKCFNDFYGYDLKYRQ
ncbi:hypothetical protein R9X49_01055 [Pectobacterium carotovorum]|uniref:hypothetical protein n=1 Tax=Pectobacterium TaxID=122277 RepID=UPI0021CA23F1|nr:MULTISPECIES: hypothetical protein [Pectobacterium]MCU1803440.1 hypothetical protein [Pectobacterium parvum]MDX6913698.1 hypothetical protein [Pectobacterium carotovorum]